MNDKCHCENFGRQRPNLAGQPVLCDLHYGQVFSAMPYGMPGSCQICAKPGKIRNVSGQHEMLCEAHYQSQIATYSDHWYG